MRRISPWLFLVIFMLLAADQLTKVVLRHFLDPGDSFQVLPYLRLDHIQNRGIAFGMLGNHGSLIAFISSMVVLILIIAILASIDDSQIFWPLALLVAGSAGNLIDRFVHGSVTDFIHFPYWPAFNLADIFIVIGVLLLIKALIMRPSRKQAPVKR